MATVIYALLGLIVVVGIGFGGYYLGHQANSGTNNTSNSAQNSSTTPQPTYHTVLSVGYPWNTSTKLTVKLAVPNILQAISISSTIQDPGFTNILANKNNDEIGRWSLSNPNAVRAGYGDISLLHVSDDWLQQTTTTSDRPGDILGDLTFTTPATKAASLATLQKQTTDCVASSTKGFVISGAINVCYTPVLVRQASGVYSPNLYLKGYGLIDGQKYVMAGFISLTDGTQYTEDVANKKGDDFLKGAIPQETQTLIKTYVDALKMTTITASAN